MRFSILLIGLILLTIQCSISQDAGWMTVFTGYNAHFIVTNPLGLKTGCDARGTDDPFNGVPLLEIPGASYTTTANESYGDTLGIDETEFYHEYYAPLTGSANDGLYVIELVGIRPDFYDIGVSISPDDRGSRLLQSYDARARGIIDSLGSNYYQLDYHGAIGAPIKFRKIVSCNTLQQEVNVSYAKGWLGNHDFYDDLCQLLKHFESQLAKWDSSTAFKSLETFERKLMKTNLGSSGRMFITADALRVIGDDATSFLRQVRRVRLPR